MSKVALVLLDLGNEKVRQLSLPDLSFRFFGSDFRLG
jgi:hypothetical protein